MNVESMLSQMRLGTERSITLLTRPRLLNTIQCVETVVAEGVPGDLLEAGVGKGGNIILMRLALDASEDWTRRTVWGLDSFDGMPDPVHPLDVASGMRRGFITVPRSEVENNIRENGCEDGIELVEGWFRDTLPKLQVNELAVLRLDCDYHASTMEVLSALYDRVSPGGFVVIDDYGHWPCCRAAVDEFRATRGIDEPMTWTDCTEVWWRKP